MAKVNLEELVGGGLQEVFAKAMEEVVENMQNPNTPYKNKREITIKLKFEQNEDRDDAAVDISVITKLAPVKPMVTRMAIGKDLRTGEVYAQEYGNTMRGQMEFKPIAQNPAELVVDGKVVDPETGEIKESPVKVLDMRVAKQA